MLCKRLYSTFPTAFPTLLWTWLMIQMCSPGVIAAHPECDHDLRFPESSKALTKFLPFSNISSSDTPHWSSTPSLEFTVDGKYYDAEMDTGSTGLLLSASEMADYDPKSAAGYPAGWHYFTSSNILWTGNWITKKISFVRANVTATVPVLAVTASVKCRGYNISKDTSLCPTPAKGGETAVPTHMPTGISYMGVGFGREYNGQLQGTPDKVPIMNIDSIDGKTLQNGCTTDGKQCFNEGFTMNDTGVTIGLTSENTKGFTCIKLALNHTYSDDPRDWTQTPGCISINDSPCTPGSLLLDTGIARSYLTLPPSVPMKLIKVPSKIHPSRPLSRLAENQTLTVHFGSEKPYPVSFEFVVGQDQESGLAPDKITVTQTDKKEPFLNTGSHFYRGFDLLYDPIGGYLGLKRKEDTTLSATGTESASTSMKEQKQDL